jgi:hypothetical protein
MASSFDVVVGKTYLVTTSLGDGGPGYSVRGKLISTRVKYKGDSYWDVEGATMHHLIPEELILEVEELTWGMVW